MHDCPCKAYYFVVDACTKLIVGATITIPRNLIHTSDMEVVPLLVIISMGLHLRYEYGGLTTHSFYFQNIYY